MPRRLPSLRFASIPRLTAGAARRAAALALALATSAALAQMHKVEAPEKVTRAIGVYEWTGEIGKPTAARFVPISLFINGKFEDAGAYLARPVPWVLSTGNEFFIEKAGQHEGTLDLEYARNVTTRSSAEDDPMGSWYGYGKFELPAAEPKPKPLKPSRVAPAIEGSDDDSRPHMSRRNPPAVPAGSSGSNSKPASSTDSGTGTGTGSGTGTSQTPAADSDRPTLSRRTPPSTTGTGSSSGSGSSSGGTTTTASNGGDDTYDPDRPTLRHKDDDSGKKKKNNKPQGYVTGPSDSLNDDPDRPRLRHGSAPGDAETNALTGIPAHMHQAVAVSDPANHPAHVFTREWESQSERTETLAAIEAQARTRITAYMTANHFAPGKAPVAGASSAAMAQWAPGTPVASSDTSDGAPPVMRTKASADAAKKAAAEAAAKKAGSSSSATKPAASSSAAATGKTTASKTTAGSTTTAHRTTLRKKAAPSGPLPLLLLDEQLSGYELSYGGLPTFLYTTQAPMADGTLVYVTLVAQKLPSGEYQVALSSITDSHHLDRTPWMRPVDVVDADNEHRASLLFELRAQNSRQFALYRLTGPQAEQYFVTGVLE